MRLHSQDLLRRRLSVAAVMLIALCGQSSVQQSTASPNAPLADPHVAVCDFKTINYITHTLPQQCLRTSWPGDQATANGTVSGHDVADNATTPTGSGPTPTPNTAAEPAGSEAPNPPPTDTSIEAEPSPRPFMSFEDWKEMMLRKAGQDPTELKSRRAHDRIIEHERAAKSSGLDSLGDDGEIDLNFDVVSEKISNIASAPQDAPTEVAAMDPHQEPVLYDDGRTQYYRSKDAGKTCKERFSYSSFDAGATVLKTNKGAKNAKAILVENKDSYMLLECSAKNKFVIVELSDDILVDTVVLANFEFFSSMIRQFRVSVSDRYPVKVDKWKGLGMFEARNSRDIQPFLVQNPLIWAKYVRIEFLSHYGNEFYCPVSLLRVHGTRMLESLKDTEAPAEEEDEPVGELPAPPVETVSIDAPERKQNTSNVPDAQGAHNASLDFSFDPLQPKKLFPPMDWGNSTCLTSPTHPIVENSKPSPTEAQSSNQAGSGHDAAYGRSGSGSLNGQPSDYKPSSTASPAISQHDTGAASAAGTPASAGTHQSSAQSDSRLGASDETNANTAATKATSQTNNPPPRTKGNSTSGPASPTVQESFFKAVSKRLQLLEANVSLSLQYIEDQSRFLQETQHLAERRQLSRIDTFLDSLNDTVLSELRNVRQQYDQIWQSTVIALESQREQSQRETVALSSRLNILADEVVFQKRMAIVQAILLLSCLVLVIFSRAITQPVLTTSIDVGRSPSLNHPLPGLPTGRDSDGVFASRYDKFGRPFRSGDCAEGDRSEVGPGLARVSSAASRRLLTPNSDVAHNHYTEDLRCSTEPVTTPEFLPDDTLVGTDTDMSYRSTSSSPPIHSHLEEGGFLADDAAPAGRDYIMRGPDRVTETIPESLAVEIDSRFPPPSRGVVPSTARKPLPALPEYPS